MVDYSYENLRRTVGDEKFRQMIEHKITQYNSALNYLKNTNGFTQTDFIKATRMSGNSDPDEYLKSIWENHCKMPNGKESLKNGAMESLKRGISELNAEIEKMNTSINLSGRTYQA